MHLDGFFSYPSRSDYVPGKTTRGELIEALYRRVLRLPPERIAAIGAP